jgi:hypothetical protein
MSGPWTLIQHAPGAKIITSNANSYIAKRLAGAQPKELCDRLTETPLKPADHIETPEEIDNPSLPIVMA